MEHTVQIFAKKKRLKEQREASSHAIWTSRRTCVSLRDCPPAPAPLQLVVFGFLAPNYLFGPRFDISRFVIGYDLVNVSDQEQKTKKIFGPLGPRK